MRSALRELVRFVASVLMVTGAMLIADAAITVVWQEPISAVLASREQNRLEDDLAALEKRYPQTTGTRSGPGPTRRLAVRYRRELRRGGPVGRIALPTLDRSYVLVEGTDPATLRRGPAHYPGTALPGEGRTVAIAGHRTTYLAPFRTVDRLRRGERIVVRMPYGRFVYEVERTLIVEPTETWVTRDIGRERLVLTACHPLYSAAQRIVIFARLALQQR
jgi:sortase A